MKCDESCNVRQWLCARPPFLPIVRRKLGLICHRYSWGTWTRTPRGGTTSTKPSQPATSAWTLSTGTRPSPSVLPCWAVHTRASAGRGSSGWTQTCHAVSGRQIPSKLNVQLNKTLLNVHSKFVCMNIIIIIVCLVNLKCVLINQEFVVMSSVNTSRVNY